MTSHQAKGNTSHGHSIQINGPVYGDVRSATHLQPSFFKTSNYESYKNINPLRVPKTCAWFLEHPKLQKWKASSGDDLLWLSADPGCGKSVLSRALIDEKLVGQESVTLCHFFFKDNEDQNNTAAALCALLHQLFWAHDDLLQKHAGSAVKKCGQALQNDIEELWQIFISAATDPSAGDVICILDALDECRQPDREKLITYLEGFYGRSLDKAERESKLKFLVTSRPYDDIKRRFGKLTRRFPTILLAGEEESENISREIGIVMRAKVEEIAEERRLGEDVKSSLQSRLCEIPNRTYLWLHLTLDEVKQALGKTEKKLLKVINILPGTVEEAYEKILARCVQKEARKVLQIIVAAQRPLTLSEIDVALEIDAALEIELDLTSYEDLDLEGDENRKEWIHKSCGLFIIVLDSRVHLIHQTAREFLVRKNNEMSGPQRWKHSVDLQEAHSMLSKICIVYLLFREIREFHKFQEYQQSQHHLKSPQLQKNRQSQGLQGHQDYQQSQEYRQAIEDRQAPKDRQPPKDRQSPKDRPLSRAERFLWRNSQYAAREYAARYAFLDYSAKHWISHVQEAHIGSSTWVSKTAVLCDVSDGVSCAWLNLYVKLGSDIARRRKNSALDWAVVFGLVNETRFLLDSGLDPNVRNNDFDYALKVAARNEVRGKELIAVFLELRGSEVNITEGLVVEAAKNHCTGKELIALILEQRGEEAKIIEKMIRAALWNNNSALEAIAFLLERLGDGVKVTKELVEAAAGNEGIGKDIIELLLEWQGGEIKITEKAVRAAVRNQRIGKEIIELLLERRGDEVKITVQVVEAAVRNERIGKEILELLLERRGDEVKITDEVVEAAVGNECIGKEIIELLLERRGDEVKITEEIFEAAVRNKRIGKKIIELLLERGADKFVISAGLLIQIAVLLGQEGIALLLERRRDVDEIIEEVVKAAAAEAAAAAEDWKQSNRFEQLSSTVFRGWFDERWVYFSLRGQV